MLGPKDASALVRHDRVPHQCSSAHRSTSARSQRRYGSVSTGDGNVGSRWGSCRTRSRLTPSSLATWAARRVSMPSDVSEVARRAASPSRRASLP